MKKKKETEEKEKKKKVRKREKEEEREQIQKLKAEKRARIAEERAILAGKKVKERQTIAEQNHPAPKINAPPTGRKTKVASGNLTTVSAPSTSLLEPETAAASSKSSRQRIGRQTMKMTWLKT